MMKTNAIKGVSARERPRLWNAGSVQAARDPGTLKACWSVFAHEPAQAIKTRGSFPREEAALDSMCADRIRAAGVRR